MEKSNMYIYFKNNADNFLICKGIYCKYIITKNQKSNSRKETKQ